MGAAHYPRIVIKTIFDHVGAELDRGTAQRITFALDRSAKLAPFQRVVGVPLDRDDALALLAKADGMPMFGHDSRNYDEAIEALTFILES